MAKHSPTPPPHSTQILPDTAPAGVGSGQVGGGADELGSEPGDVVIPPPSLVKAGEEVPSPPPNLSKTSEEGLNRVGNNLPLLPLHSGLTLPCRPQDQPTDHSPRSVPDQYHYYILGFRAPCTALLLLSGFQVLQVLTAGDARSTPSPSVLLAGFVLQSRLRPSQGWHGSSIYGTWAHLVALSQIPGRIRR